jgi:hypothetical protein
MDGRRIRNKECDDRRWNSSMMDIQLLHSMASNDVHRDHRDKLIQLPSNLFPHLLQPSHQQLHVFLVLVLQLELDVVLELELGLLMQQR